MSRNTKGLLILLLTSLIWGCGFAAQDAVSAHLPPLCVTSLRSFIGCAALLPLIGYLAHAENTSFFPPKGLRKKYLAGGIACGVCLFAGSGLQQWGIAAYPQGVAASARAGFLTALYVILVPLISLLFRKKVSALVWLGALMSVAGLYLLCLSDGLSGVYRGDIFLLLCALSFAAHILVIGYFTRFCNGVWLACIQFFVCGVLSLPFCVIQMPGWQAVAAGLPYVLYLGLLSSGVAYTLQIVGQSFCTNETAASLVMSLESVFAALGGVVLMHDHLSPREIIGCAVMFCAIVVSQLPAPAKRERGASSK